MPRGLGQTSGLAAIVAAIAQQEGFNTTGTVANRNNNPGNLIASPWTQSQPGYAGQDASGFAIFATPQDGQNALAALVQNYASKGDSISQMMAAWAPASQAGNDPTLYAQNVANAAGVSPDTPVADAISGGTMAAGFLPLPDLSSFSISDTLGLSGVPDWVTWLGLGLGAFALYKLWPR